jgi:hypothetical protein
MIQRKHPATAKKPDSLVSVGGKHRARVFLKVFEDVGEAGDELTHGPFFKIRVGKKHRQFHCIITSMVRKTTGRS